MVYYLRPRTSLSFSPSTSRSPPKSRRSPYHFYKASPASEKAEPAKTATDATDQSSPSSPSVQVSSPVATPVSDSSSDMLKVAVPYLIIAVVVSAVVATVIMVGVKPCKGCSEFLTSKDDKGELKVNNVKVIGFSLVIGLAVALLCFGVHSASPSLFDP